MKKQFFASVFAICASASMVYASNSPTEKESKEQKKVVSADYGLCQSTYDAAYSYAYTAAVIAGHSGLTRSSLAHRYAEDQARRCMLGG
ncbi:MAG: hypothetical protein AB8B56_15910 [Crocinitomicaceae bacterium]